MRPTEIAQCSVFLLQNRCACFDRFPMQYAAAAASASSAAHLSLFLLNRCTDVPAELITGASDYAHLASAEQGLRVGSYLLRRTMPLCWQLMRVTALHANGVSSHNTRAEFECPACRAIVHLSTFDCDPCAAIGLRPRYDGFIRARSGLQSGLLASSQSIDRGMCSRGCQCIGLRRWFAARQRLPNGASRANDVPSILREDLSESHTAAPRGTEQVLCDA